MPLTLSKRAQVVPQVKISPPENLVLDNLAIRPAATFNLRRTTRHYDGAMVTVRGTSSIVPRREFKSDVRGDLDIRALLAFIGNGSGFIDRWNNPNDSSRDAVQATEATQPRIVSAGVLEIANGRAGIRWIAGSNLVTSAWGLTSQPFTRNFVFTNNSSTAGAHLINSVAGSPNTADFLSNVSTFAIFAGTISSGYSVGATESWINTSIFNGAASSIFKNNAAAVTSNAGTDGFNGIQVGGTGGALFGWHQGITVFASALSTVDRQLLERDQAKYFSILGVA